MAPMSTAIAGADGINTNNANVSPIRCIGGWVGPCPSPSLPESTFGLLVQLQARPPTFTTGDPADPDALETRNIPAFVTESKRAGCATAAPPPGPADTVTLQTLRLSKLPGAPVGGVRTPEYRARLDFRLVRSRTMGTITLHANSVFVAAPARRGGGSAHRVDPRRAAAYTFRVLALEDLPRSEPGTAGAAGATTTVINAAGGGVAETFARAWCSQKGVDAVVWQRDGGRSCFKCALMVAGEEGLGVKVLIMV
ncbi:uncharacterized protein C8A04DRAFT_30991 [Dichotomopilus funicola]|uniref:Uncharacterized protein n=1 Tax=Dichotomopilus funicola TaxID=1934379 RepID=A0AAN6UZ90_9PEZI|nr:hypothetical protein C8A04DRAFT_30991 [Dichotomopilus funicola]